MSYYGLIIKYLCVFLCYSLVPSWKNCANKDVTEDYLSLYGPYTSLFFLSTIGWMMKLLHVLHHFVKKNVHSTESTLSARKHVFG